MQTAARTVDPNSRGALGANTEWRSGVGCSFVAAGPRHRNRIANPTATPTSTTVNMAPWNPPLRVIGPTQLMA
jgi:hypothetical protein